MSPKTRPVNSRQSLERKKRAKVAGGRRREGQNGTRKRGSTAAQETRRNN